MEMKIPDNDIYYLADHFQSYLVMKNGETIDLDLHLSIRGKEHRSRRMPQPEWMSCLN